MNFLGKSNITAFAGVTNPFPHHYFAKDLPIQVYGGE
jgi:hypothetical protein